MLINSKTRVGSLAAEFLDHAGYGVDIFFALSGYLICTFLIQEKNRTGTISLGRFYTRRAFRILPPIILYLSILLILSICDLLHQISVADILHVLLFARNYFLGTWYTGHFWSLAVEEHFYLVAPLILLVLSTKWAMRAALVLILLCISIRWFEFAHFTSSSSLLQFRTENRFDGLLWGCVVALLLHKPWIRERAAKHVNSICVAIVLPAAIVLLMVFTSTPARRTVVAAVMPILISYTVLHPASIFGKILELSVLRWVGRLSYSLYIWQMLFLPPGPRPLGPLQSFPFALILALACAVCSYYLVEKPMLRVGHRLAGASGERPSGRYS